MSGGLHFGDHGAFHRQILRLVIGGAVLATSGLVVATLSGGHAIFSTHGLFDLAGVFSPRTSAPQLLWMTVIVTVLGLLARPPARVGWVGSVVFAGSVSLLGALVLRLLVASPPVYPWFGVGVWGMGIGVLASRDLRDQRRFTVPLALGLTTVLATWVQQTYMLRLLSVDVLPSFVAAPIEGALFAFLVGIGLVARQVTFEHDRVAQEFSRVKGTLSGEMLTLAERARSTYRRIMEVLRDRKDRGTPPAPTLLKAVDSLVFRIFELGGTWQEVENEANRTSAEDLGDRLSELEGKIAASTDAVARRQYEMARDAIVAQLGYLRDISRSRERVIARVYNYLAALDRLLLGVLNHRGADAAKFDATLAPMIDEIATIGQELDFVTEAMREVDAGLDEEPVPSSAQDGMAAAASTPGASGAGGKAARVDPEGPEMPPEVAARRAEKAELVVGLAENKAD